MHPSTVRLAIVATAGLCLFALSLVFPALARNGYAAAPVNQTVPILIVAKEAEPASVAPGERITYTLAYSNVLTNRAFVDVELVEVVPENTTFVKGDSSSGWSCADGSPAGTVCNLSLGDLDPADDDAATFVVEVLDPLAVAATGVDNEVQIKSDGLVYESASTVTPLNADIDLNLEKRDFLLVDRDANGIASPGDTLRYTITTKLEGNSPVAALVLNDNPDANTMLITGTVTTTIGTVISGNGPGDTAVQVELGDFKIGDEAQVAFDVMIRTPLPATVTRIGNQAFLNSANTPTVGSDDPATPNAVGDATFTTLLARAELAATKTDELLIDADSSGNPSPGDTLRYRVVISNDGNQSLAGVKFEDILDPNTELVAGSVVASQGLISTSSSSVSVDVGTVPGNGGSVEIVFAVRINTSVPNGVTEVTNQGTLTSAVLADVVTDDPDFAGSFDPTRTSITAEANLYLTLRDLLYGDADGDQMVSKGDTLLYEARIFNNGNQGAVDIVYEHVFSPQLELVVETVRPNQSEDANDNTVKVKLPSLEGDDFAVITYIVKVVDTGSRGQLTTQSRATFTSGTEQKQVVSDDPDTATPSDPTVTVIGSGTGISPTVYLPWTASP